MKNSFFLVIPEQRIDPIRLKLYEETALKQWLEELPIVNLSLSTRFMHDFIQESNKLVMSAQQRIDFLELIRPCYLVIEDDMRSRLVKAGFPKSNSEYKIYNILVSMEREYSIAYWIAVKELTRREISWFQGKNTTLAIQRTIKGLSSIVISQYIMSLPISEWVWIDLHSLYRLGLKIKKETTRVPDNSCLIQHSSSIQDSYKQIILLSLTDPTGLIPKEIQQVYEFTEKLCALISLDKHKVAGVEQQCVILQDEDLPPSYLSKERQLQEESMLYIGFTKLYKTFEKKEKLKNDVDGRYSSIKLSSRADRLPIELLNYLEARWQGVPLKGVPLFADRLNRYFSIGLDSAYDLQVISGVSENESYKEYLAESSSQTALTCIFDQPGLLAVGSFISFRKVSEPEHKRSIGVVNKISMEKGTGKIRFEINLLTLRAHTVMYSNQGYGVPGNEQKEKQKALIYGVKVPGAEEKSFLIVESFMLKELDIVRLYLNEKNFPIVLRARKNIGVGYWQFECRQLEEQEVATKSNKGYDFT